MVGPELPDLIAGLVSLISLIAFVQFWKPKYRPEFQASFVTSKRSAEDEENFDRTPTPSEKVNCENHELQQTSSTTSVSETDKNHEENAVAGEPQKLDVERLTLKQALLGWSPWVLIVLVVLM